ncbi:radical SAM protein [Candidatus Woesearchaeota archaeon]|nr:radical SAM protein [Candidatus Woesearchaeota archaeon]
MDCFISSIKASVNKEYPGKITQTVYFNGCNMGCNFCPNPKLTEFSSSCRTDIKLIISEIAKKKDITDCICLSGGEPLLQKDAVREIIKFAKGINIAVKTNGTNPSVLSTFLKYIDIFDLYLIAPLNDKFKRNTGTTARFNDAGEMISAIRESISILKASNKYVTAHSYLVPGQLYRKEDFLLIADEIKDFNWKIHPLEQVSKDYINNLVKYINKKCPNIKVVI